MHYANRLVWHGKTALKWLKNHRHFVLAVVGSDPYRLQVRDHRWEVRYGLRLKREEQKRVYYASLPSHYRGWSCITNGAYPGAAHEGNGVNGPYSGPLGMTNPWMGYSGDWVHMNPTSVYAIAERVAARYGFSYSFMKGQWPNTFPPCANLF